jgi:hypothetical protein
MPANPAKTLLSPDNHSLLMIDHQYLQMLTIRSHNASELIQPCRGASRGGSDLQSANADHDCLQEASGFGRASGRGDQGSQADRPDDSQFVGRPA